MINLADGVRVVQTLVRRSLAGSTEPFLTTSRLEQDLRQITECLRTEIAQLVPGDLQSLFQAVLFLHGYRITGERTFADRRLWDIQLSDSLGIRHSGMGAVAKNEDELQDYQSLMNQLDYPFAVLLVADDCLPSSDTMVDHVKVIRQMDLVCVLIMLAIHEYANIFVLTLAGNSDLKKEFQTLSKQETGASWEAQVALANRWTTMLSGSLL